MRAKYSSSVPGNVCRELCSEGGRPWSCMRAAQAAGRELSVGSRSRGSPGKHDPEEKGKTKQGLSAQHGLQEAVWWAKSAVSCCLILPVFGGRTFCTVPINKRDYIIGLVIQAAPLSLQTTSVNGSNNTLIISLKKKTKTTFGDYQRASCIFQAFHFYGKNVTFPFVSLKNENTFNSWIHTMKSYKISLQNEIYFLVGGISKFREQKDLWGHEPGQSEDLCDDLLQSALVP